MAFVPLIPVSFNVTMTQALAQQFDSSVIQNAAGTVIDLSAWVSLTAKAAPVSPNPTGSDVTFGTVTADAAGKVHLQTSPTDLATAGLGTAKLIISGKPTAGDSAQVLATGVLTLAQG